MRKNVIWTGLAAFAVGLIAGFLSGATNGPSAAEQTPIVGFLYGTNQILWLALAVVGIIVAIVGLCMKKKAVVNAVPKTGKAKKK